MKDKVTAICLCMKLFLWFCSGSAGHYRLDQHGDRDVNFSVIYTTNEDKVIIMPFSSDTQISSFCQRCLTKMFKYKTCLCWMSWMFYAGMCWCLLSCDPQYDLLFTFDTEHSITQVDEANPSFIWGNKLPDARRHGNTHTHTHTHTHTRTHAHTHTHTRTMVSAGRHNLLQ